MSRDVLLLVFFLNQFPPSLWLYHQGRFDFFLKFAEIFAAQGLPPVSTVSVATGVADTGGKFATVVVDTGSNFAAGVVDTGGAPWLANISANFRKNSKRSKWKLFHEKNQKQKSRDTFPLTASSGKIRKWYSLELYLRIPLIFPEPKYCSVQKWWD